MKKVHVLYNPAAGKGKGETETKKLDSIMKNCHLVYSDITKIENYALFFASLDNDDEVIISGGDGTLSFFADDVANIDINNPVYYYATGSGNDFLKDLNKKVGEPPFLLNEYIDSLPVMTVNGKETRFVNGVGGGLDAYACVEGNKAHEKGKNGNYVLSAVKGLLYDYKPMNATVWVDGKEYKFEKVWFASVMHGRYFGGGIMLAPNQNRKTDTLSMVVVHKANRLRLLPIIPGAFKGKHVKYTHIVNIIEGRNIKVHFDTPVPLQVDGETEMNVTEYSVVINQRENAVK